MKKQREIRDPEVMVPETPYVSRGTTNKDNYTGRSKNVDRSKKGLGVSWADEANVAESSCDNEAHQDRRATMIVFVDSPSNHPPTVDRGSDTAPGQERMEVVKSSVSGSQDRGIKKIKNKKKKGNSLKKTNFSSSLFFTLSRQPLEGVAGLVL